MQSGGEVKVKPNPAHPYNVADRDAADRLEDLLRDNNWTDLSALHYLPAEIAKGQEPSLGELLDPNDDGILTSEEYKKAQGELKRYTGVSASLPFANFKQLAKMSLENPERTTVFHDVILPRKKALSDPSREDKYKQAQALLSAAIKTKSYEEAEKKLGESGMIFAELGFKRLMERCNRELIRRAMNACRLDDAAFYRATAAMAENRIDEVEDELKRIPHNYEGRTFIADYAQRYRALEKMTVTFNAAQAITAADMEAMKRIEEKARADLAGLLGPKAADLSTFDAEREALTSAISAWNERLQNSKFLSSRAILEDIWRNGSWPSKRGVAILAGHRDTWKTEEDLPAKLEDLILECRVVGDHVVLSDLLEQEEKPNPAAFYSHLVTISGRAEDEGKTQVAWVAGIYKEVPHFRKEMSRLMAAEFEDRGAFVTSRNFLRHAFQPENAVIMIGGFALARWTTSAVMARLAPGGVEGATLAARIAVPATEVSIEALGFTVYQRILTSLLTTQKVDWSLKGIAKDWAALTFSLGFLRATNMLPLKSLRQTMGKTKIFSKPGADPVVVAGEAVPQLNRFGNTLYGITQNITQTAAFYTGSVVSHGVGITDMPPHLFEQWLTLVQFQLGVKLANIATKGFIERTAFEIRTRPIQKLSKAVAEALLGGKSPQADALAQRLFYAEAKGDVSLSTLRKINQAFENREGDILETHLRVNEMLKDVGVTGKVKDQNGEDQELALVYYDRRLHEKPLALCQAIIEYTKARVQASDKRRSAIVPTIRRFIHRIHKPSTRKRLKTWLNSPTRRLWDAYFRHSNLELSRLLWADILDVTDVTRTIYTAEELAFLALVPPHFTGHGDFVPAEIARRLEATAEQSIAATQKLKTAAADLSDMVREANQARRESVKCLQEILNHYASRKAEIDEHEAEYLKQLERLVKWNRDALYWTDAPLRKGPEGDDSGTMRGE
jgi:hypothetical protein